jgi:hypothetical protein
MNFFELTQKIAKGPEQAETPEDSSIDKNSYIRLMGKLSQKLGNSSNTYTRLVRYVSKNPEMLSLLEKLIEETSLVQSGKIRNIFPKKS